MCFKKYEVKIFKCGIPVAVTFSALTGGGGQGGRDQEDPRFQSARTAMRCFTRLRHRLLLRSFRSAFTMRPETPNHALQQTAAADAFLEFKAHFVPTAAELGCSAPEG